MKELTMIEMMMARPSWLLHKDHEFVKSVSRQLDEGKRAEPSFKQAKVIRAIHGRWQKNQKPHIYVCGSPGNGRG